MIIFPLKFLYKDREVEASVHELETPPKQWHVSVKDNNLSTQFHGTYLIQYDHENGKYTWGFPNFDTDHSFMKSIAESLRNYLLEYGWNSVSV